MVSDLSSHLYLKVAGPTWKIQSSSKLWQVQKWQAEIPDTPLGLTDIGRTDQAKLNEWRGKFSILQLIQLSFSRSPGRATSNEPDKRVMLCSEWTITACLAVLHLAQMKYPFFLPELCKQNAIFSVFSHQNSKWKFQDNFASTAGWTRIDSFIVDVQIQRQIAQKIFELKVEAGPVTDTSFYLFLIGCKLWLWLIAVHARWIVSKL